MVLADFVFKLKVDFLLSSFPILSFSKQLLEKAPRQGQERQLLNRLTLLFGY